MTRLFTLRAGLLAALLLPGWAAAAGLNDTGITQCANLTQNGQPCPQTNFPRQDANIGRDAQATASPTTLSKAGAGPAGFDFTKLDSNGQPLADNAPSWDCVRDNVTGLVWEVKTNDNGLRHKDWTYTWYNPDSNTNGGNAGSTGSNTCGGFLSNQCNTQAYTAAVNALIPKLCGFSDWRMPTLEELRSLVNYSGVNPTIDINYFPNTTTRPYSYWSSSPSADRVGDAWYVYFNAGGSSYYSKASSYAVRLVRGGQ